MLLAIARSLVDHPERVILLHVAGEREIAFQLRSAPEDVGKLIGSRGRIARAIRVILHGTAMKNGRLYTLDIAHRHMLT